ncbi:hypothetical protein QT319_23365 [Escherichia coli]|nr:hypothetical protein [Escherichia coli]
MVSTPSTLSAKIERFAGSIWGSWLSEQIMQSPAGQTPQRQALAATANGIDTPEYSKSLI